MNLTEKTMEQKKTFEPFEKVILKNKKGGIWVCDILSHEKGEYYFALGNSPYLKEDFDILPFEGNAHLVGTSDMPDEEVYIKAGELCAMFRDEDDIRNCRANIRSFCYCNSSYIYDTGGMEYGYCVKLSQFNHNDMEETRKHILCVKEGKLVKAIKEE